MSTNIKSTFNPISINRKFCRLGNLTKFKLKKIIIVSLLVSMLLCMLPTMTSAVDDVCQIIDTDGETVVGSYADFADALTAVGDLQTIKLLDNINYANNIVINGKSITFNVNGFTLLIEVMSGNALTVDGGIVLLDNSAGGRFNVRGGSGKGHGVYTLNGGKATVTNAYTRGTTTDSRSVYASGAGSTITVIGNVDGGFYGLGADGGATITVGGYVRGGGAMSVSGSGTTIIVGGSTYGGGTGVFATDGAIVHVGGNANGGGVGVYAASGAQVTVNGSITMEAGGAYVRVAGIDKAEDEHESLSSKAGYFEYKNGGTIVWVRMRYTVTFNGNGGEFGSGATDVHVVTLPMTTVGAVNMPDIPTRNGYTFTGWNTNQNGAGIVFTSSTLVTEDITVYAQWTIVGGGVGFSVVYDGNGNLGGFAPVDFNNPYLYGDTVIVFGRGSLARDGYSFLGWSTLYDAIVVEFVEGDTFTIEQDTVLFAVWSEGSSYQYTVTYHPGTYGTFEPQITTGLSFGDLTPQAPQVTGVEGWKFAGWNPMPTQTVTGSIVYTAQWEPLEGDGVVYVVHYYLQGTTVKVADSKNVTGQMVGAIVTEVAITISGYTALAPTSITAPLNTTGNVFVFYYTANSNSGGGSSGGSSSLSPKPPTTTTQPPTTPPNTTTPPPDNNGDTETLAAWALVNLILSVVGVVLAIVLVVCVLLQRRQMQKGVEEDQGQSGGRQFVGGQQWHVGGQEEVEVKRQRQCRLFWCFLGVVMGVAGIIVFLLTEDINNPMTLVDKWTIINAILFIAEIIAVALTFKRKKTNDDNDTDK